MESDLDALMRDAARLSLITFPRGAQEWKMEFRNRVKKKLIFVKGSELRPHLKNPRLHPDSQVNAVRGVLEEVGIAGVLLVYRAGDGMLTLIDGECRSSNFAECTWPCVELDVSDVEAEYLLATHDPLAALAETDVTALQALLAGIDTESPDLRAMFDQMLGVEHERGDGDGTEFKEFTEECAQNVEHIECPNCGHRWPK